MEQEIVVLFGGPSREHLVSVASAQNIALALGGPTCWFWAQDGLVLEIDCSYLLAHENPFQKQFRPHALTSWNAIENALAAAREKSYVFFNALHGVFCEDGALQKLFEDAGLGFTGSGARASKLSFNKSLAKSLLQNEGLLVAPTLDLTSLKLGNRRTRLHDFLTLHKKIVVKPICEGSSFGLFIVESENQFSKCLEALDSGTTLPYIAEAFIEGTEVTVGVLETLEGIKSLASIEIAPSPGRFFDYKAKYLSDGVQEILPARISQKQEEAARSLALRAHKILGCEGYSRTDMIVRDNEIIFLEINTLPGLSVASLVPQELAAEGISMRDFAKDQISLAQKRQKMIQISKNNITTSIA